MEEGTRTLKATMDIYMRGAQLVPSPYTYITAYIIRGIGVAGNKNGLNTRHYPTPEACVHNIQ